MTVEMLIALSKYAYYSQILELNIIISNVTLYKLPHICAAEADIHIN